MAGTLYLGCFQVNKVRPHTELHRGAQSQSIAPPCFEASTSLLEVASLSVLSRLVDTVIVSDHLDFLPQVTHSGTPVAWLLVT